MDKSLYPSNWKEISLRIRERAGWRCEWCNLANGLVGYRDKAGNFIECKGLESDVAETDGHRVFKIVLSVAHLDHNPQNCDDNNLKALCQRCHLRYDTKLHVQNAAQTRRRKRIESGQMELFSYGT
jgi:5-methylcytosine-specific restriction endonuclease McrA